MLKPPSNVPGRVGTPRGTQAPGSVTSPQAFRQALDEFEKKAPRVLYTWIGPRKLKAMIQEFQGAKEGFFSQVYCARTPLSTFMYGPILVRIKLRPPPYEMRSPQEERYFSKPGSDTKLMTHLRQVDLAHLKLREYIFTRFTPDLIESFSYSTPEILRELDEDRKLVDDPNRPYLDFAFRDTRSWRPILFDSGSPTMDGHPWNPQVLKERLEGTAEQVRRQEGQVFYAPDVSQEDSPHFTANDLKSQLLTCQEKVQASTKAA